MADNKAAADVAAKPPSTNACMGCVTRVLALVRKNMTLKLRTPVATLFETFAPVAIIALLILLRRLLDSDPVGVTGFGYLQNNTLPRDPLGGMAFFGDYLDTYDRVIAVGPRSPEVNAFTSSLEAINPKFQGQFSYFNDGDELNAYVRGSNGTYPTKANRRIEASILFTSFAPDWEYTIGLNNSFRARGTSDDDDLAENIVRLPRYDRSDTLDVFTQDVVSFFPELYWFGGLSSLQMYTDNFILRQRTNNAHGLPAIAWNTFPEPAHVEDFFPQVVGFVMTFFGTLSMIWPVFSIAKHFGREKEEGLAQGMFMMGLEVVAYFSSMVVTYGIIFFVTSISVMLVLLDVFPQADSGLMFLLFLMYCLTCLCYAYMIQAFFRKAKTAAIFAGMIFFVSSFGGFTGTDSEDELRLMCLAPSICLSKAYEEIALYERIGGTNVGAVGPRVSTAFWMFVVDWVLFIAVGAYFSVTRSTAYGTQMSYWFLCTPSYWQSKWSRMRDRKNYSKSRLQARVSNAGLCKSVGPNTPAAFYDIPDESMLPQRSVVLRDVCLTYNAGVAGKEVRAVKHVSLDLFEGEIHALLGHNGAGKTSLVSVLTGLSNSTSGYIKVNGYDTRYDMAHIRERMGVCTQHNTLFDDLTVREHLQMFSRLKRVNPSDINRQIDELARELQLVNELDVRSKGLSGGYKRKLGIAIALIGDTTVVYLDEPTSGLDTYARKAVWDVLKKFKEGRTIVLTTHFMDEADFLGDRISIMTHGSVSCSGSSLFLKRAFGVGYTFTLTKSTNATKEESERLRDLIETTVPDADLLQEVAGQIVYRLKFSDSDKFPAMFDELETHMNAEEDGKKNDNADLGLDSYSIGVTTLEEVFVKVGQMAYKEGNQNTEGNAMAEGLKALENGVAAEEGDVEMKEIAVTQGKNKNTKGAVEMKATMQSKIIEPEYEDFNKDGLWFRRNLVALLYKRLSASRRDLKAWIYTAVLPPVILALGMAFSFAIQSEDLTPVAMNPIDSIGNIDTLHVAYNNLAFDGEQRNRIPDFLAEFAKRPDVELEEVPGRTTTQLQRRLVQTHSNHTFENRRLGAFAFNFGARSDPYVQLQDSWNGTAISPPAPGPRAPSSDAVPSAVTILVNTSYRDALPAYTNALSNAVLNFYTSASESIKTSVRALPRTESENAQVSANAYFYLGIGLAFVPANAIGFIVRERMSKSKHLQRLSGVKPIQYWLANYIWDTLCFMVTIPLLLIVLAAYGLDEVFADGAFGPFFLGLLFFGLAAFPLMYCCGFLFKDSSMSVNVIIFAAIVTGPIMKTVTDVLRFIALLDEDEQLVQDTWKVEMAFRVFPTFCIADIMGALITRASAIENIAGVWDMDVSGYSLLFLAIEVVVYFSGCLVIEYIVSTPQILSKFQKKVNGVGDFANFPLDQDIQAEQQRILEQDCDDPIQIHKLRKTFKGYGRNKVAVDDLTFGVGKGEIFGFLGSNGAGKTSTMKMLIGDMLSDEGFGLLAGFDTRNQQGDIRRRVGYCPQFDALIPLMTARETLTMFATFKGVKENCLKEYVSQMLTILDLGNYADKPCGTYSGGNKRKLSVGMALIGNPPIVFLDEPSSGMDPQSKRFMWNLVSNTMGNRSVVLTTHSMDEAEALCGRIGIMVAGKLRCVGSTAHLKHRYGNGLQLDFSLPVASQEALHAFMGREFSTASPVLLEARGKLVKVRIDKHAFQLSDVFRKIEAFKQTDPGAALQEYCVSETTLEQIFIRFANEDPRLASAQAVPTASDADTKSNASYQRPSEGKAITVVPAAPPMEEPARETKDEEADTATTRTVSLPPIANDEMEEKLAEDVVDSARITASANEDRADTSVNEPPQQEEEEEEAEEEAEPEIVPRDNE